MAISGRVWAESQLHLAGRTTVGSGAGGVAAYRLRKASAGRGPVRSIVGANALRPDSHRLADVR